MQSKVGWGGLEYNTGAYSLLDGSVGTLSWFYALGFDFNYDPTWCGGVPTVDEWSEICPGVRELYVIIE